jgi:uncharacterized protein with ParB-like and HNH nuclease domain
MKSKIEADDKTYEEFIEKGSNIHVVPSLQRPYTWGKKEVEKFLNDVLENDIEYYIGSIVMVAAEGSTKREEIIDGQQRLTTISLILVAIRKVLSEKEVDSEGIKDTAYNLLVKPEHKGEGVIRLEFSNENSQSIYRSLVLNETFKAEKTEVQKNFETNFEVIKTFIREKLEKDKKFIAEYIEKISKLQIIFIKCLDKNSAYTLFESINATGISLASTDLIKNAILRKLSVDNVYLEKAEKEWLSLEDVFNEDVTMIKTYLRHHWISGGSYTSHTKLFDEFQEKYSDNDVEKVYKYLQDLSSTADIYNSLRTAAIESLIQTGKGIGTSKRFEQNEIKASLEFLEYLGVDQVYSVLLHIYKNDLKNFRKELNKLTSFQFLFKYVSGSPSTVERKFANYCTDKYDKEYLSKHLQKICKNKSGEFIENFIEKTKYRAGRSGDIQFVLEKIAQKQDGIGSFTKPTIEHVVAQKPSEINSNLKDMDSSEYKNLINTIGNLTIVELEDNGSELSNKPVKEKMKILEKSKRKTHNNVTNYKFEKDAITAISNRSRDISGEIYDLFFEVLKTGKFPGNASLN